MIPKSKTGFVPHLLNILVIISVSFALTSSLVCLFFCQNNDLSAYWVLPLIYAVGTLFISYKNPYNSGMSYNILHITMFVRYVLTILITVVSSEYHGIVLFKNNYNATLFLMLYEMIVVFIIMKAYSTHNKVLDNVPMDLSVDRNRIIAPVFVRFEIIITLSAIIFYPAARNTLFNFLFTEGVESVERLNGFMFVFFKIGISIIYALIIQILIRKSKRGKLAFLISCLISVLYISCNWTGNGNISRWGLVTSALVSYMVLSKVFPLYKRALTMIGGISFAIILLFSSIIKLFIHHGATGSEALIEIFSASYLNEYFQGVYPVANGITAMKECASKINLTTFLDDTISAYPFVNKLFFENGNLTETMYLNILGLNDKILPTISQGYAYFGYIGAPIFSGIFTYIALRCDTALKKTGSIYYTIAYTEIGAFCALFMAINVFIIQRTTMYFVLLLIVLILDKCICLKGSKI